MIEATASTANLMRILKQRAALMADGHGKTLLRNRSLARVNWRSAIHLWPDL